MNFTFYNKEGSHPDGELLFFGGETRRTAPVTMRLAADSASYIDFKYTLHNGQLSDRL